MDYVPILRFRDTEVKILNQMPKSALPLLEIVDEKWIKRLGQLKIPIDKGVMMELPCYLTEQQNKYSGGVESLLNLSRESTKIMKQAEFYLNNMKNLSIPVVSSPDKIAVDYGELVKAYNELKPKAQKKGFEKIGVRVFVSRIQLSEQNKDNFRKLVKSMSEDDTLLLDVVEIDNLENNVLAQLKTLIDILVDTKCKARVILLNAFDVKDWRKDSHDFGPLLAVRFNLAGFGDFATIPRDEFEGGRGNTYVIRYFSSDDKVLHHFYSGKDFRDAKIKLTGNVVWKTALARGHLKNCDICEEINKKDSEWKTFWKIFRISHHINSMIKEVIPDIQKYKDIEDLDTVGWDIVSKKGNLKKTG